MTSQKRVSVCQRVQQKHPGCVGCVSLSWVIRSRAHHRTTHRGQGEDGRAADGIPKNIPIRLEDQGGDWKGGGRMGTTHTEKGEGNGPRREGVPLEGGRGVDRQVQIVAISKNIRCALSLLNSRPSPKTAFYILLGGVCKDPA